MAITLELPAAIEQQLWNEWDEFFSGQIRNRYTRAAYLHAVRRFLKWAEPHARSIDRIYDRRQRQVTRNTVERISI